MTREPFVDAKTAARFAGFSPKDEGPTRDDIEMKRFYAWLRLHAIPRYRRGPRQLLFRLSELEAAIERLSTPAPAAARAYPSPIRRMEALADEHVFGAVRGGRR